MKEEEKCYEPTAVHQVITHFLDEMVKMRQELREAHTQRVAKYESEETGKLYDALSKAQLEMETAKMDSSNPFFKSKYADLASIIKASRGALAKNGLSVIQRILPGPNGASNLHTRMGHSSGQWMESRVVIDPPKKDVQSLGSYITYLRRYSYAALVGVVSADEDDDGEAVMQTERTKAAPKSNVISKAQLQILGEELKGEEELLEYVLKTASIGKLSDLKESRYTNVLNWVRENKKSSKDDE